MSTRPTNFTTPTVARPAKMIGTEPTQYSIPRRPTEGEYLWAKFWGGQMWTSP